jgi:hypothetical protein
LRSTIRPKVSAAASETADEQENPSGGLGVIARDLQGNGGRDPIRSQIGVAIYPSVDAIVWMADRSTALKLVVSTWRVSLGVGMQSSVPNIIGARGEIGAAGKKNTLRRSLDHAARGAGALAQGRPRLPCLNTR